MGALAGAKIAGDFRLKRGVDFIEEMAERREKLNIGPNDHVIGCPLCAYEDLALPEEYVPRSETTEAEDGDAASENADEAVTPGPANR